MVNVVEIVVRTVNDTKKGLESAKSDFNKAGQEIAGALKPIGLAMGGSGLLAMASPLAAAGVAAAAFGGVAAAAFTKANAALKTLQSAEKAYNSATTPAAKAAAYKRVQDAQHALTGSQEQLLNQEERMKGMWNEFVDAMTPLVVEVTKFAITLMHDLMPALGTLVKAGAQVIEGFLKPLDTLVRSSSFGKFIKDVADFAKQAAPVIGTMLVGALQLLMSLMEQLMPVGLQLLKVFTPLFLGVLKSAIPIIKGLAVVLLAVLTPLSKYPNVVGPLVIGFYGLLKVLQLVKGVFLLLTAAMELNPVILITTAIIALAVGFGIAWKSSSTFRDIVKDIAKVMLQVGIVVLEENKAIVNAFLWMAGTVIHAAASAFGWVPGLGGKLRGAATDFDHFRAGVNNSFDAMIGKMRQWQGELGASQNKANTATQVISGDFGKQLLATTASAKGVNTLATAIGHLHSKNLAITMSGKGTYSLSQINASTGKQQQAASGLYITSGSGPTADDNLVRVSRGELIVPTHMVNAGEADHMRGRIPGFKGGGVVGNLTGGYVTGMYGDFQNKMTASMVAMMRHSLTAAEAAAAKAAASAAGGSNAGSPGGGTPGANAALARKLYPGWATGANWTAWNNVAMRESGWSNLAHNPGGAFGIAQALGHGVAGGGGTYGNQYGGYGLSLAGDRAANNGQAGAQIQWMANYMRTAYGGPIGAWNKELSAGFYGAGGPTSAGWATVGEHGRELIKVPGGATVYPHGGANQMLTAGSGGPALVQLEIAGGQSEFDKFMLTWIKNNVRVKGGGSVQKAFGGGSN